MKKIFFLLLLAATCGVGSVIGARAHQPVEAEQSATAEIKFDTLSQSLGTFPVSKPHQQCRFTFTNTGDAPLILQQVFASCGCTVAEYPKTPIKPGEGGVITVNYDGSRQQPGRIQKTVTVRSNARNEIVRLKLTGSMTK